MTKRIKYPGYPKQKMQEFSFNTVEELLDFLPPDELKMVTLLRKLVFSSIPGITEKLNYNVPYYKRHSNICFIWPSTVLWGNKKKRDGVRFGFTKGYLLQDEMNYLDKGGRKQVYWKDFYHIKDIETDLLRPLLIEAAMVDAETGKKK